MSYKATTYKVMIASPSDVEQERKLIREIIHEWNAIHSEANGIVLMPVGWDTHAVPSMGGRPQEIINRQVLKGCDLLVAVFWTRIGSATGKAVSGTVEEIEEHIAQHKPAMIYFSQQPVRPDSVDEQQYNAVKDFKAKCSKRGLIETYESLSDFRDKFSRQLPQMIAKDTYFVSSPDTSEPIADLQDTRKKGIAIPNLCQEAQDLLIEASKDPSGMVMKLNVVGGPLVQTNGKQLVERGNPRSQAAWEGAINELCNMGLLVEKGHRGEVFGVTAEGYRVADAIVMAKGD